MGRIPICFVDDEDSERTRFERYLGEKFAVGVGPSIEGAEADLRAKYPKIKRPDLYLLDLYYSASNISNSPEKLKELEDAKKKFFAAQTVFQSKLTELDQGPDGGFNLARALRAKKRANYAFFTRKGLPQDFERALSDEDALAVILKPNPNEKQQENPDLQKAYDEAFESNVGNLERLILKVASKASWRRRHEASIGVLVGFLVGVIAALTAGLLLKYF